MNKHSSWTESQLKAALPELSPDANKYTRGKLIVIAGSERYPGAACLAARGAQRMGAGYTEVVASEAALVPLLVSSPSLVVSKMASWDPGVLANLKEGTLRAVCIGPGFVSGDSSTDRLVVDVLKAAECPVLVDGGGLAVLASKKALKALSKRRDQGFATIITPHTGEAARLCQSLQLESRDAGHLAKALAMATGVVAVVKGPDTYISSGKRAYVMREGTPALAKAGTGDVLAGMIASLLAQGVEPVASAILGTTLHARAGIVAAEARTARSVTAEDVIDAIPVAIRSLGK